MTSDRVVRVLLKPVLFAAALTPIVWLAWSVYTGNLGADPLADVTHETGAWALRFLCATLAVTPVRRLTGWNRLTRFRRMLGLFAFFYATVHLLIYAGADRLAGLDLSNGILSVQTAVALAKSVVDDVRKRPFITAGFTAWACMLPLALTSTAGWIRRLGGRRWNLLHRLIYLSAVAACVHYYWLVKSDIRRPLAYGAVVVLLLGFRIVWSRVNRRVSIPQPATSQRSLR